MWARGGCLSVGEGLRVWTRVWARACEWARTCECGRERASVGEGV